MISAAGLWLVSASALWSKGTGTAFTPLAWWDAAQWWRSNWWVNLWLVLAAAAPTILLEMLLFALFQVWRLRYRGRRRLTAKPDRSVRAVERSVTDNHSHAQWRSMEPSTAAPQVCENTGLRYCFAAVAAGRGAA
jgi:hypothetical protein